MDTKQFPTNPRLSFGGGGGGGWGGQLSGSDSNRF